MKKIIKNKYKSKVLVLGLILSILIGFFSPVMQVSAQTTNATGSTAAAPVLPAPTATNVVQAPATGTPTTATTPAPNNSDFYNKIIHGTYACSSSSESGWITGCFTNLLYFITMVIPSYILYVAAYFFNVFIAVTLTSKIFTNAFIPTAWAVVRDLSNIFFILILLYISIRLILGFGGHDSKKMIAKVIIIALLINFSMFFTEIVIDSSNILALVFYNKVVVGNTTVDPKTGIATIAPETSYVSAAGEKDFAGGLTGAFNPANKLTPDFFASAAAVGTQVPGSNGSQAGANATATTTSGSTVIIPFGLILGIMLLSGTIMAFASYALFVAAFCFVGRMIELFVLIIFSPFAFMSFTVPILEKTEYIGWHDWFSKLIKTSFMAPIFMFFMYFIFLLVGANLFNGLLNQPATGAPSFILNVLGIALPAALIIVLLLKAVEFAKKGSGQFGEMVMKGAQMVGGLALGIATSGASVGLQGVVGKSYQKIANDDNLRAQASGDKAHFARMGINDVDIQKKMQKAAQKKLATANKYANKSWDIRDTGIGKFAAKKSGLDLSKGLGTKGTTVEGLKGGYHAQQEKTKEEEQKKQKTYEMSGEAAMKQNQRVEDYNVDKEKARGDYEAKWEKQYQADKTKAQEGTTKGFTFDEKKFRADYEKGKYVSAGGKKIEPPPKFDKAFKEAYEKGGDLSSFGLNKKVDAGSVQDSKQINADRRKAYGISLETKAELEQQKGAMRTFFADWREGMKEMTTTAGGIGKTLGTTMATAAAAGIATGGIGTLAVGGGAGVAILGGGFLHAFKKAMTVKNTNMEVIAAVRKGEDPLKHALHEIAKATADHGGGHGDAATHAQPKQTQKVQHAEVHEEHNETTKTPEHAPSGDSHGH